MCDLVGSLGVILDECERADDNTTEDAFASVVTANAFGCAMGPCMGGILFTVKGPTFVFLAFVVLLGMAGILCSFYINFPDGPLPAVSYDRLSVTPSPGPRPLSIGWVSESCTRDD